MTMRTPVAFFVFCRPETTEKVWTQIRKAEPKTLYLCADAARPDREGEAERVAAARRIVETVDWECDVHRIYADRNMGCDARITSALNEIFQTEERVIVLEDDCLPDLSFFRYCNELLDRYEKDERVLCVCGANPADDINLFDESYAFSRKPSSTGWATWRRAWALYDESLACWEDPARRAAILGRNPELKRFLGRLVKEIRTGVHNPWDTHWLFVNLERQGLSCVPRQNLINHLYAPVGATHVTANIERQTAEMAFPLVHPNKIERNATLDKILAERIWDVLPLHRRILRRLRLLFNGATA
ncbi:MAG: hypothetical protein J6T45_07390 [Fibrobacterales bacterium]|nr:hypothetical protein [Fibrobacterales bacterium]